MQNLDAVTARKIAASRRTLACTESAWGSSHEKLLQPILNLADLYFALGDYHQAELLYDRFLSISCKVFGYEHANIAFGLRQVGEIYEVQGLYEDAERMYLWALSVIGHNSGTSEAVTVLSRLLLIYQGQQQEFKAKIIESRLKACLAKSQQVKAS